MPSSPSPSQPSPLAMIAAHLGNALGSEPIEVTRQRGGDINDAYRVRLADGRAVFVKCRDDGADLFRAEAEGLRWLAEPGTVRTPKVLHVDATMLVLEWIDAAPPASDHDEQLGTSLANLHRSGAAQFGLEADNVIGTLPQVNTPCPTWPEFYATRRLEPLVRRAVDRGHLDASFARRVDRVVARLDVLTGDPEPPARLHGDLWAGNAMTDERGAPVLIDPAVYGGHREIDLAMMQLFGGFGPRVFAAYDEVHPRGPGHQDRVPLYQLYPLLVHVNLFPHGGWSSSLAAALDRC
jgi:fructosamine-3-kinase